MRVKGVELVRQAKGTFAGENVKFGEFYDGDESVKGDWKHFGTTEAAALYTSTTSSARESACHLSRWPLFIALGNAYFKWPVPSRILRCRDVCRVDWFLRLSRRDGINA